MFPRTCFQEHVSKNLFFAYLAQRVNTQLFDIFAKEQKGVKKRSIRLTAKPLKTGLGHVVVDQYQQGYELFTHFLPLQPQIDSFISARKQF